MSGKGKEAASSASSSFQLTKKVVNALGVAMRVADDGAGDPTNYVFEIIPSPTGDRVAVTSSSLLIKLYSLPDLTFLGELKGHTEPAVDACFSPANPNILVSCDPTGTVCVWDVSRLAQLSKFKMSGECFSVSINCNSSAIAIGHGDNVSVFPFADGGVNAAAVRKFDEIHQDDVTQVRFHPGNPSRLVTASVDGLICQIDLSIEDMDDAVLSVLNAEQPVQKIAFFGDSLQFLFASTTVETFSLWDLIAESKIASYDEVRSNFAGTSVDYIVGARYLSPSRQLLVLAGDFSGNVFIADLSAEGLKPVSSLPGGHSATVRAFFINETTGAIYTGGEDSLLCIWTPSAAAGAMLAGRQSPKAVSEKPKGPERIVFSPY